MLLSSFYLLTGIVVLAAYVLFVAAIVYGPFDGLHKQFKREQHYEELIAIKQGILSV